MCLPQTVQVSTAHSQDRHDLHGSPWGAAEGPMASHTGKEASAIHRGRIVHCSWLAGGNLGLAGGHATLHLDFDVLALSEILS